MKLFSLKYFWLRLSLRARFLYSFLALSFIIFAIVSYVAISSMENIGNFAGNSASALGLKAAKATGDALEVVGKEKIQDKAYYINREISAYLVLHPDAHSDISHDSALAGIAVQHFGDTGYTFMYEETQLSKLENAIINTNALIYNA